MFTAACSFIYLFIWLLSSAAHPALPEYLQSGNNLCVVALNVHARSDCQRDGGVPTDGTVFAAGRGWRGGSS